MKLSAKQLATVLATYVAENKVSVANFTETRNNTVGLIDAIGKIFTITHNYVDKLEMFDGEFLSYGKTIEEWANDLILAEDYRPNGERALSRHELTYRPVYFSYTLGRKVIPLTIGNNDIERAVHNEGQFVSIIEGKTKALADSKTMFRYAVKRQLLGLLATLCVDMMDYESVEHGWSANENVPWTTEVGEAGIVGETLGIASDYSGSIFQEGDIFEIVKPISVDSSLTLVELVNQGYLIQLHLISEVAKPVDATTGEDFIVALKDLVEKASDFSEGYSLNGATLGATPEDGLILVLKQGIMGTVDVKTLAGAFHLDKIGLPTKIVVVPDLGDADESIWGLLTDVRGIKLHPTYDAVRENVNGDGDFLNMFQHMEFTGFASRNTFVQVFKEPKE